MSVAFEVIIRPDGSITFPHSTFLPAMLASRPAPAPRPDVLTPLVDALVERVAERLGERPTPSAHYTTSKRGPLPPGKSRAWALRTLKTIPGARKVGRDWVVSTADYQTWLTAQDMKSFTRPSVAKVRSDLVDLDAITDAALTDAGFRRTR